MDESIRHEKHGEQHRYQSGHNTDRRLDRKLARLTGFAVIRGRSDRENIGVDGTQLGIIPRRPYRFDQTLWRHARGIVVHSRISGHKVDRDIRDAGHRRERSLDSRLAGRTRHPRHRK